MSDFTWWFKNPLFSNVWITQVRTSERFPAHGLCLSQNPFFKQVLSPVDKNASMITQNFIDGKITIDVTNLCVAEIYIKSIYSNKYDDTYIQIDLGNRNEIMEWLHYAEMWFMSESVFKINYGYVLSNITKILETDIYLVPELSSYFEKQYQPNSQEMTDFYIAVTEYMEDHENDLTWEMLEWRCSEKYTTDLIISMLESCQDVTIIYKYYMKLGKLSCKQIAEIVHDMEDLAKVDQFYQLIDSKCVDQTSDFIRYVHGRGNITEFYSNNMEHHTVGMIAYADIVCKSTLDISIHNNNGYADFLVLESFHPFKGTLYVAISKIDNPSVSTILVSVNTLTESATSMATKISTNIVDQRIDPIITFRMFSQVLLRVGDQLFYNNTNYIISHIFFHDKDVREALPLIYYHFCLKNTATNKSCTMSEYPTKGLIVYKIEKNSTWCANINTPKKVITSTL